MYIGEFIKNYREQHNLSMQDFANITGLSKAYIGMLEKIYNPKTNQPISPSIDKLNQIALGVGLSLDDLLKQLDANQPVTVSSKETPTFTKKDERDIQKRLQNILDELDDKAALNFYNGDEAMDEETKELMRFSIEASIRLAKSRAKQKFTPNKYKDKKDWLPLNIKGTVEKLIKNNNTNNPFEICKALDIVVKFENLGNIFGYCDTHFRMRSIHINENVPEHLQAFVCAHELGHALLHRNINTPFLSKNTLFSIDKIERQANTFAVELLLPDSLLKENEDINFYCLAQCAGIPNGLESLKFKWSSILLLVKL